MRTIHPLIFKAAFLIGAFFPAINGFIQAQTKSSDTIPVYSVLDYGVINDGTTMNTEKIQQLIDEGCRFGRRDCLLSSG